METQSVLIKQKEKYFDAFFIALVIAFLFFIPYILIDKGYFLLYGDFNVQQVPFYKMSHDAIRSGNIFWNWETDLGVNFIGSYSFYLLGSPFFWITLLFPSSAVPFLMGPLLMLKFAFSSLTGYMYIKRFVKNKDIAVIGGLLYAFSGFAVYNIFFNHFHEAIVYFPLLLVSLEEFMQKNRRGFFAIMVAMTAIVNYFFFVGMVVFIVIYWVLRLVSGAWEIDFKKFLLLALEAVLGMGLAMIILLPSLIVVASNPRTTSTINGFYSLFYDWEQRYGGIISCFFFPPDLPARPNMFPKGEAAWASLGAWLPLFSMTGVIAWMQTKQNWLKKMIITLCIFAMVPILNSLFFLLNSAYYARWFYMLTLMMALSTVMAFERKDIDWNRALRWSFGITLFIVLTVGFIPQGSPDGVISKIGIHNYSSNGYEYHLSMWVDDNPVKIGLYKYPDRFWVHVSIALASLLVTALLINILKKNPKKFAKLGILGVAVVSVIYSTYFLGTGKTLSYNTRDFIVPYMLEGAEDIKIEGIKDVRIDGYDPMDNMGMFWQIPCIYAFHTVVPASVMEFYPKLGVERSVGTRPDMKYAGLRNLLSVKYMFDYAGDSNDFGDVNDYEAVTKIPGFKYYDKQNNYYIWANENYVPMGFAYKNYITQQDLDDFTEDIRDRLLLKAVMLDDEQIEKYGGLMEHLETGEHSYSDEDLTEDCDALREECAYYFKRDNKGFDSKIKLSEETLVMYSIPYEEGWSATVNGKAVTIEKVDNGLCAIKCEEGENIVRFNYMTPGLINGIIITAATLLLFAAYLILIKKYDRYRLQKAAVAKAVAEAEAERERALLLENMFDIQMFDNINYDETINENTTDDISPDEINLSE